MYLLLLINILGAGLYTPVDLQACRPAVLLPLIYRLQAGWHTSVDLQVCRRTVSLRFVNPHLCWPTEFQPSWSAELYSHVQLQTWRTFRNISKLELLIINLESKQGKQSPDHSSRVCNIFIYFKILLQGSHVRVSTGFKGARGKTDRFWWACQQETKNFQLSQASFW